MVAQPGFNADKSGFVGADSHFDGLIGNDVHRSAFGYAVVPGPFPEERIGLFRELLTGKIHKEREFHRFAGFVVRIVAVEFRGKLDLAVIDLERSDFFQIVKFADNVHFRCLVLLSGLLECPVGISFRIIADSELAVGISVPVVGENGLFLQEVVNLHGTVSGGIVRLC